MFSAKAANAYQTYLTAERGWAQVTDLSSLALDNYYFAIVSNNNTDLMVKMDKAKSGQQNSNHSMWYNSAADPLKDNSYLWILETNPTKDYVGYTIRNVERPVRVIQTNENEPWFARTNWETSSARWTSYAFNVDNGVYSIQALANGGSNYLGLWKYSNGYVSGQELAGNKSGDEIGKFLIYAISKSTADATIASASDASSSAPYDLAPSLFGRKTSNYTGPTGYYGDYQYVERYQDNVLPSTGDKITKTITTAPNGYHKITIIANAAWISGRGNVGTEVPTTNDNSTVVTINGVSQNVPVRTDGSYNPVTLTFPTLVTDNTINFAITNKDAAAFWFVFDITSDLYYGNTSEALENLGAQIDFAEEVRDNSTCSNATARSTFETAISTAKSKTVIDATEDDVTALSSAIQAYEREAYPTGSYTFDMTWLLNNTIAAGGGNMDGWYHDITVPNFQVQWNNSVTGAAETSYFFEAYNGSKLADGWALYQKATLPEGAYKLEAYAFQRNAKNDVVLAAGNSKGRFINSSGTDGNGGMRLFSTLFYSDGENESKMGIKILSSGVTDWCGLNKMKLYKVADSYTSALSSLIVTCESYLTHSTCEDGDKTTFQSAVNTAKEASGSASAQAKAYEALESARQAYVVAAEPDEGYPFDMTYLFTNADVTGQRTWQGIYGWYSDQTDGNSQVMTNDEVKTDDGKDAFYEYWSGTAKANGEFTLYQKLTLPEGTYSMSCYAFASPNGVAGADVSKVYFYANDTQGDLVSESVLTEKGISFVNREEQEVKIGLKALAGNKYRWMGIGYVELYKVHPQTYTVDENQTWDNSQSGAGDVTLNRTIKAGVNTLVLPFSMTQTEVESKFGTGSKVYAVSSYNAETENISFVVRDGISANQPCLLKATEAGTIYELTDRTIVAGTPTSSGTNVTLTGSYAASIFVPQATSNYIVSGDNLYQVNSAVTMKNTRAYITISGESGARLSLSFDDDDATIISALEAADAEAGAQKDGKYLENGKIVIVKNGVKYSANGQILK